jgi:hypothetical protein
VTRKYQRTPRYPYDLAEVQVPAEAMDAAKHETFRFVFNWDTWKGDIQLLCALCYMQGALDGAQVQQTLLSPPQEEPP